MPPRTGDTINGHKLVKVEDYGHDTSLKYTLDDGRAICAAHWDFDVTEPRLEDSAAEWHWHRKSFSSWGS
jgi:hypothetical protein